MQSLLNPCRIVTSDKSEKEEIFLQDYPCQTSNYIRSMTSENSWMNNIPTDSMWWG